MFCFESTSCVHETGNDPRSTGAAMTGGGAVGGEGRGLCGVGAVHSGICVAPVRYICCGRRDPPFYLGWFEGRLGVGDLYLGLRGNHWGE